MPTEDKGQEAGQVLQRNLSVIQYRPPLLPRAGILRERKGANAIVEFDGVRKLVPWATLRLLADLRDVNECDNLG